MTIKGILIKGQDAEPLPAPHRQAPTAQAFVRAVADLVGSALGGLSWN
jgi:hypothetical protein